LDASAILANHQISQQQQQQVVDQQLLSDTSPSSSTIPQTSTLSPNLQQSLQNIAHNNSTNNNSCNNSCNDNNNNKNSNRPQLVPFNKFSSQSSQQSISNPNLTLASNISSLPSLVNDSRQSSEDSGYSEPTSSSTSSSSGGKTYAQVMASINDCTSNQLKNSLVPSLVVYNRDTPLCPYATNNIDGICPYSDGQCHYLHGDICDLCGRSCLHPNDIEQQKQHREVRH